MHTRVTVVNALTHDKTCVRAFLTRARVCVQCAEIFMNVFDVVNYYFMTLSRKFHKDPSFDCGNIGKIKLTFCNQCIFKTVIKTQSC